MVFNGDEMRDRENGDIVSHPVFSTLAVSCVCTRSREQAALCTRIRCVWYTSSVLIQFLVHIYDRHGRDPLVPTDVCRDLVVPRLFQRSVEKTQNLLSTVAR